MLKQPEIIVFAGPNGSGKSTFTTAEWVIEPYINADELVKEKHISNLEAAKMAEELRESAVCPSRTDHSSFS